ncbi:MAG: hypothetical protein ACLFSG_05390 [Halothiobacillaceae bacterium]
MTSTEPAVPSIPEHFGPRCHLIDRLELAIMHGRTIVLVDRQGQRTTVKPADLICRQGDDWLLLADGEQRALSEIHAAEWVGPDQATGGR